MQEINALVQLIQHSKFRANGLLNIILDPNSQMRQLYDALANGQVETEEDLRKVMPDLAKSPSKLYTLKSRLKDRLLDSVLFLDLEEPSFRDRQIAFGECVRKWSAALILFSKNSWQSAVPVLENLLRHTQRFEFTEITINIIRSLRLYYGIMAGDRAQYEDAEKELRTMELVWSAEYKAETLYTDLVVRYVCSKSEKEAIVTQATLYLEELKPLLAKYRTYKLHFFGRLIEIMIYDSLHDYQSMARASEDAVSFFEGKDYYSATAIQAFYYNLLLSQLNIRNYDKCQALSIKFESLYEGGTFNWFKLQELYFLAAMHSGNYTEAARLCSKTMQHPLFKDHPAHLIELWKIFEAYIHFLTYTGKLPSETGANKFKVAKFINDTQLFSRDKRGMNIPILIIHFIFSIAEGRLDELDDRADNMIKYRSRYLDESAIRSNNFFRMLEQLTKAKFQVPEVEKKAQKYFDKLRETPLEAANQSHEIEILPYEVLWNMILELLPEKKDKRAAPASSSTRIQRRTS